MKMIKKINNNVALVSDRGTRAVVIGLGVGFNARPGSTVDESRVQERFVLQQNANVAHYMELLKKIPANTIEAAVHIVRDAARMLDKSLPGILVFTLADHIGFARERLLDGIVLEHPLACEIAQCYPDEYRAALHGVEIMSDHLDINVPEAEASFIAIHIASALGDFAGKFDAAEMAEMISGSIALVERGIGCRIDRSSMAFSRFVAHVRYYLMRRIDGEVGEEADVDLFRLVSTKYAEAFSYARAIETYLTEEYGLDTGNCDARPGELLYLTLHINRLISNERSERTGQDGQ